MIVFTHKKGTICENEISQLQKRYMIKIDKYVIMPNHIHMVIVIDVEWAQQSPSPTISDIICTFKSLTNLFISKGQNKCRLI
ncbi:MAG: transposase [Oscillospiraceae bacterium]